MKEVEQNNKNAKKKKKKEKKEEPKLFGVTEAPKSLPENKDGKLKIIME